MRLVVSVTGNKLSWRLDDTPQVSRHACLHSMATCHETALYGLHPRCTPADDTDLFRNKSSDPSRPSRQSCLPNDSCRGMLVPGFLVPSKDFFHPKFFASKAAGLNCGIEKPSLSLITAVS